MAYSQQRNPQSIAASVHATVPNLSSQDNWLYGTTSYHSNYVHNAPLQEPVPFEDFQFSFGLDPNFAIPVPLDMPPAPPAEDNSQIFFDESLFHNIPPPPATDLLNEDDQRIFTNFLDNFCMDPEAEPLPPDMSTLYDIPSYRQEDLEDDERRRNSILRSLDEQKRMRHRALADTHSSLPTTTDHPTWLSSTATGTNTNANSGSIYLKKSDSIATPYIIPSKRPDKKKLSDDQIQSLHLHHHPELRQQQQQKQHQLSSSSSVSSSARRSKPHKELLTEAEKRANHIASEQKRRTTIRSGFKDLTDIVPTLKNINNSKSTVLFKAVDYIKYLEKRTKHLREKIHTLELRLQVEGRSAIHPATLDEKSVPSDTSNPSNGGASTYSVISSTEQALKAHSVQQKHLLQLQEELQQKLMAHHHRGFRPVQEEMDVDEEPLKATVSA
ncbi:hypothetical protein BX666DRAFT_1913105 [Dichotomocladium elegans]|nr:hypothetical protein BX666DRAFT_1913105 [Dichotomocladium elegans]